MLSFSLHSFWQETWGKEKKKRNLHSSFCVFIHIMFFLWLVWNFFLFITDFSNLIITWFGFLYFFILLAFVVLFWVFCISWVSRFIVFIKSVTFSAIITSNIFLNIPLPSTFSLLLEQSNYTYTRLFDCTGHFFFSIFSLCFILDNSYCYIFMFIDHFFSCV